MPLSPKCPHCTMGCLHHAAAGQRHVGQQVRHSHLLCEDHILYS